MSEPVRPNSCLWSFTYARAVSTAPCPADAGVARVIKAKAIDDTAWAQSLRAMLPPSPDEGRRSWLLLRMEVSHNRRGLSAPGRFCYDELSRPPPACLPQPA